ncbi:AMP-binding enzyme, partial [Vibrio parahaemolyticus]
NVAPTEVENVLRQHPSIADVAVVGLPSEHSGEEVVAAVVVADGCQLDPEEVRTFARGILTPYKVPRRIVVV